MTTKYYTETQSNILIIVILLHPKLENDISTPAPSGQKPPEQISGLRCTALVYSWMPAFTPCGVIMYKAYICKAKSHRWPGGRLRQRFRAITEFFVQIWTIWHTLPNWSKQNCNSKFVRSNGCLVIYDLARYKTCVWLTRGHWHAYSKAINFHKTVKPQKSHQPEGSFSPKPVRFSYRANNAVRHLFPSFKRT